MTNSCPPCPLGSAAASVGSASGSSVGELGASVGSAGASVGAGACSDCPDGAAVACSATVGAAVGCAGAPQPASNRLKMKSTAKNMLNFTRILFLLPSCNG